MFDSDHTIVSGKIITTTVTRTWTDDSSLAWSADVGYQLNRYIGIEASYWDLGSAAYDQTRTYLIIVRAPRCRSDDREVGVAPQRQGTPLIKARNDLIDRPSGNPLNE
jgi:hypothetical protein